MNHRVLDGQRTNGAVAVDPNGIDTKYKHHSAQSQRHYICSQIMGRQNEAADGAENEPLEEEQGVICGQIFKQRLDEEQEESANVRDGDEEYIFKIRQPQNGENEASEWIEHFERDIIQNLAQRQQNHSDIEPLANNRGARGHETTK